MFAARLFILLARIGSGAFGDLGAFTALADLRFFFRALAFFVLARLGTGQRMGAGVAFIIG